MRLMRTIPLLLLGLSSLVLPRRIQADEQVELELVTEPGYPVGSERRWLETLGKIPDVSVRIRASRGGERPEADDSGSGLHVLGVLTSRNELKVPGGSFRVDDVREIKAWLEKLRSEGAQNLTAVRAAFGLTEEQLVELHEALQKPVTFSTLNLRPAEFLQRIADELPFAVEHSATSREQLTEPITDELKGLSFGTSMAAALRPCGLVMVPQRVRGKTVLTIVAGKNAEEFWPAGWDSEKTLRQSMPALLKFLNVGITDTPLDEAVGAIQQRLEAPILWDHNALARDGIEPHEIKVTIPAGRSYYKRILDKVLSQGKLRCEVRVDEAGTPFVWITSSRGE